MMDGLLNRETVILELGKLAMRLSKKVESRTFDAYFTFLQGRISEEQFVHACTVITEEDDRFPAIARILTASRGHQRRERGEPYIRGCGPLRECLADLDAGRAYGGEDQFRGRPHVTPMIERLVYEDAAVTVEALPEEGVTDRLRRIAARAESEIARLEAAAMPQAQPEPAQAELPEA